MVKRIIQTNPINPPQKHKNSKIFRHERTFAPIICFFKKTVQIRVKLAGIT
jgi:hypothetical protein